MVDFNEYVDRTGTFSTQWDFIQDRFSRTDITPFSISDTDFKAPEAIVEKIKTVAEFGVYGYTRWNHDAYRKTIQNYFKTAYDTDIQDEWVIYSPSVMYSVSLLIRMLKTKTKPRVLTFTPMYDSFFTVITENGCDLVSSELYKHEGRYHIDFKDFETKIQDCSVFLLCAPHNPTGKVFTEAELERLVSICEKYDVAVVSDEIHMDITLSSSKRVPLYKIKNHQSRLFTATSASKVFNIPGLGGSFVIVSDSVIRNQFLKQTKTRDFVNSANIMGMWATIVGYQSCTDYIEGLVKHTESNFKALKQFVDTHCPTIQFNIPEATYLAWLDISALPCTPDVFLKALEDIGHVGFMGGKTYGDANYIRINCGCPLHKLEIGMEGLKKAYDAITTNQ